MPEQISDIRCKLCKQLVFHNYLLKNTEVESNLEARWFFCACGCMFNLHKPDKTKIFTNEYRAKLIDIKEAEIRYDWYVRNYITIVEEKTYGRKFLDVGYGADFMIMNMRNRGWVSTGIDLIPGSIITNDFEIHNFHKETFDFIFMGDVLQCFDYPMQALRKAYNLLNPCGLMLIVTPNTDLFKTGKISDWGYWDIETNRQFFSFELLKKMIQRIDHTLAGNLRIIYADDNLSQRFVSYNNMHVLCRKEKIEE